MPNVRLGSFTIEPNADIKVWTPEVATVLYCGHLRRCDEEREGLDDESAVVERACAPRNGNWLSVLYQETPVT
jgi:hypothetical protein